MAENIVYNPPSKKKKYYKSGGRDNGQCDAASHSDNVVDRQRKQKDDESSIDATVDLLSDNPPTSSGLKNTLHGNVFQLKLLMLFSIRGIGAGYEFNLGTEIPGMGGKFDDLIFKFCSKVKEEKYRYLQAKHKQNEKLEKITAADLLNDNNGEFSLPKYFRSYYNDIIKPTEGILPESVHDCIICTNIGFDSEDKLANTGIELIRQDDPDDILTFDKVANSEKTPIRYKLRKTEKLCKIMSQWSDIHLLAKTLLDYATDNKKLTTSSPILKSYHFALVDEKVVDKEEGKLCTTFLEGKSQFREILCELTFVHYWDKLKLKSDDKKKMRVDGSKKLNEFDETSLLLPQYSKIKSQKMKLDFGSFTDFYDELIAENIVDSKGQKANTFTRNFIHGINLSPKGLEFRGKLRNVVFIHYWNDLTIQISEAFGRKTISSSPDEKSKSLNDSVGDKERKDFLDKLVFAVHTPNEVELDDVLKREVSDCYSLNESDFQSDFILRNMLDWFKKKESKFMTSKEGENILKKGKKKMKLLRLTAVSIDYQKQLREVLQFNRRAIDVMKEKLGHLLTSSNRIGHVATPLPKRTAVKVIAALEKFRLDVEDKVIIAKEYFQYDDSYLVTSSSRLLKDHSKIKKALKSEESHNLLVVVCEDDTLKNDDEFYEKLIKKVQNKRVIIVSKDGGEVEDVLNFCDLNATSKRELLEKEIEFQGATKSVGDLIGKSDATLDDLIENGGADNVLDCNAIEELIETEQIKIPSCSSSRFEPLLYVERQLNFPSVNTDCTSDALEKEYNVDSHGNIEWFVKRNRQKTIWDQMKSSFTNKSKSLDRISENDLMTNNWNKRAVIICGLAGTGKSTILSNLYERMKKETSDYWTIKIDLVDYCEILSTFNFEGESNAIKFFVNHLPGMSKSSFAQSLLAQRFQTDGRIVVMLDGFDEIDVKLHEKVFHLIKSIRSTNFASLVITTRSHYKNKLEDQLFQFAYLLENFSQEDQINYLSKYWQTKLAVSSVEDKEHIQRFAGSLVARVCDTLKDNERNFIGVPLQCRILAECFETQLQETITQGSAIDCLIQSIDKDFLDLANLYRRLMKKKLEIYRQEKVKENVHNHRTKSHIDTDMANLEHYLRELAIQTIIFKRKYVSVLLGDNKYHQSESEVEEQKVKQANDCVCFGLLDNTGEGKVQFLHRTYAEYFVAEYIYKGFHLDDKRHNRLLVNEPVRGFIIKLLAYRQYDGVQVFVNSMFKEIVDEDAKWREMVDNRQVKQLPDRLKTFTKQWKSTGSAQRFLEYTVKKMNGKIFKFICDCFDVMFDASEFRRIMKSVCNRNTGMFHYFYEQSSETFERFIKYYDTASKSEVRNIFEMMVRRQLSRIYLDDADETRRLFMNYSLWKINKMEKRKVLDLALDFLIKHKQSFKETRNLSDDREILRMMDIVNFFSFNEYYGCLLEKWLSLYDDDDDDDELIILPCKSLLIGLPSEYYSNYKKQVNMENTLTAIRNLGRYQILERIARLVLLWDPHLFTFIYQPTCNVLSLVQRAVFEGDTAAVVNLLQNQPEDCSKNENKVEDEDEVEDENKVEDEDEVEDENEDVHGDMARDDQEMTPFYIAAAIGHEEMCHKLLAYAAEGDVRCALRDAIHFQKMEMFRLILTAVKSQLGQNFLLNLLKFEYPYNGKNQTLYYVSVFSSGGFQSRDSNLWFKTVVDIVVENEEHWNDLSQLILHDTYTVRTFYYVNHETFKQMLKAKGFKKWIQLFLDIDIFMGFNLLCHSDPDFETTFPSQSIYPCPLKMFDEFELSEFIAMLTNEENSIESYWIKLLKFNFDVVDANTEDSGDVEYSIYGRYDTLGDSLINFLELILEKVSKKEINQRFFDISGIEAIAHSMLLNLNPEEDRNLIGPMVGFLQDCRDEEINQNLMLMMPFAIENVMFCIKGRSLRDGVIKTRLIIVDLIMEKANCSNQLATLVDALMEKQEQDRKKRSIWSYYFKYLDFFKDAKLSRRMSEFLRLVSKKHENGGSKVKELVLHEYDGEVTAIRRAKSKGKKYLVKAMLAHLNQEDQDQVRSHVNTVKEYEDSDSWDEEETQKLGTS